MANSKPLARKLVLRMVNRCALDYQQPLPLPANCFARFAVAPRSTAGRLLWAEQIAECALHIGVLLTPRTDHARQRWPANRQAVRPSPMGPCRAAAYAPRAWMHGQTVAHRRAMLGQAPNHHLPRSKRAPGSQATRAPALPMPQQAAGEPT